MMKTQQVLEMNNPVEESKRNITTNEPHLQLGTKLKELFQYRYLLQNLIIRDLKVRYKNSLLGVLWSLLNPMLMMLVFSIIFSVAFGRQDIREYPVFFLVGLIPWQFLRIAYFGYCVDHRNGVC